MVTLTVVENIVRETEKAIQFDAGNKLLWVPKSQIEIDANGVVFAKKWLANKLGIGPKYATKVMV